MFERQWRQNGAASGNRARANNGNGNSSRRPRGFAAMQPEAQRAIARKGGQTVSKDREHMAQIGRKGGSTPRSGNHNSGTR